MNTEALVSSVQATMRRRRGGLAFAVVFDRGQEAPAWMLRVFRDPAEAATAARKMAQIRPEIRGAFLVSSDHVWARVVA